MSRLMTKEEAMHKYGIDDMRKFNTKDFIKIMSSLDKMDPEVVKELIGQIPNFLNFANETTTTLKESFDKTIKSDDESLNSIYANYDSLIGVLTSNLEEDDLSLDDKLKISSLISDLIHQKEETHFKQQQRRHELFKTIAISVSCIAVAAIALLSGGEISKSSDTPTRNNDYS